MNGVSVTEKNIQPLFALHEPFKRDARHRICIVVGMGASRALLDELVQVFSVHTNDIHIDVVAACDLRDIECVSTDDSAMHHKRFADAVIYVAATSQEYASREIVLTEEHDAHAILMYAQVMSAPLIIMSNNESSLPLTILKALQGVEPCACELISICDTSSRRAALSLIDALVRRWSKDPVLIGSIDVLARAVTSRRIAKTAYTCMGISQRKGIIRSMLPRFLRISDFPLMSFQQFMMLYDLKNMRSLQAVDIPNKKVSRIYTDSNLTAGADIILIAAMGLLARNLARKASRAVPVLSFVVKPSVAFAVTYAMGCAYSYLLRDAHVQKTSQNVRDMAQKFAQSCTSCVYLPTTGAKKQTSDDNDELSLCGERIHPTSYIEIYHS